MTSVKPSSRMWSWAFRLIGRSNKSIFGTAYQIGVRTSHSSIGFTMKAANSWKFRSFTCQRAVKTSHDRALQNQPIGGTESRESEQTRR
jgi:hypothetical protein